MITYNDFATFFIEISRECCDPLKFKILKLFEKSKLIKSSYRTPDFLFLVYYIRLEHK